MTLSRKYKPGSRQNFSFQNRILYKKAQCCGELPWLAPTCENFPPQPIFTQSPFCYGRRFYSDPVDNKVDIVIGNGAPGQDTGNNYELYFGNTLLQSWVNEGSSVSYTIDPFDWTVNNGRYTMVVTNNIGCTVTAPFDIIGIQRPDFTYVKVIDPSFFCDALTCTDTLGSELEISVLNPYPGLTYKYVLKQTFGSCSYVTGTTEGAVINFIDICSDVYNTQITSYLNGQELCDFYGATDFRP